MPLSRTLLATAVAIWCVVATFAARTAGDLESVYRARQWFELRNAVTGQSPALMRAAIATAFNDPARAEALSRDIIRAQPEAAANDAFDMLSRIYIRAGQYSRFLETYREWAAAFPSSAELREERENEEKFRGRPNQTSGGRRRSTLRHWKDGFSIPVSVDGKTGEYLFDTGAWQSAMTEPEARRLV
jgi:predicted aspartyl protease